MTMDHDDTDALRRRLLDHLRGIPTTWPRRDRDTWARDVAEDLTGWLDERLIIEHADPSANDEDHLIGAARALVIHLEAGVTTDVYGPASWADEGGPYYWTPDPDDVRQFVYVETWPAGTLARYRWARRILAQVWHRRRPLP